MAKLFGVLTFICFVLMFVCSANENWDGVVAFMLFTALFLLLTIISAIVAAVKATTRAVKDVAYFVGDLIDAVVSGVIDLFTIEEQVRQQVPNAFKVKILEKKKTAVDVGIFNKNDQPLQQMHIESDEGVSNELQVGQEYYL